MYESGAEGAQMFDLAVERASQIYSDVLQINSAENIARKQSGTPLSELSASPINEKLAIIANSPDEDEVLNAFVDAAKKQSLDFEVINFAADETRAFEALSQGEFDVAVRIGERIDCIDEIIAHTKAKGIRMGLMPYMDITSLAESTAFTEDVSQMRQRAHELLEYVKDATAFRIQANDGTDLTIRIDPQEPWIIEADDPSKPLEVDVDEPPNFPQGEIFKNVSPGSNGVIVLHRIDSSVWSEPELDEPVVLRFTNGFLSGVEGGLAAQNLRDHFASLSHPAANRLVEMAIGLNYGQMPQTINNTVVNEKQPFLHFAVGDTPVPFPNKANETNFELDTGTHLDFVLDPRYAVSMLDSDGREIVLWGAAGSLDRYRK